MTTLQVGAKVKGILAFVTNCKRCFVRLLGSVTHSYTQYNEKANLINLKAAFYDMNMSDSLLCWPTAMLDPKLCHALCCAGDSAAG